jgi:hypothetical protein
MKVASLILSMTELALASVSGSVPTASMQASAPPLCQVLDALVDIFFHEVEHGGSRFSRKSQTLLDRW